MLCTVAQDVVTQTGALPSQTPTETGSIWTRELAPAVMPVVIGFILLLILISVLGYFSVRRMDEVSVAVLGFEQEHAPS